MWHPFQTPISTAQSGSTEKSTTTASPIDIVENSTESAATAEFEVSNLVISVFRISLSYVKVLKVAEWRTNAKVWFSDNLIAFKC